MKKRKVLLCKVTAPLSELGISYDQKFLSLALFYLKAFAEKEPPVKKRIDFSTRIFGMGENDEDILRSMWEEKPDVVAFSSYLTEYEKTVNLCRKINYVMPEVPIILGGPCVLKPVEFMSNNPHVAAVVEGEGEIAFTELMKSFANGDELQPVPGATVRAGGVIVRTPHGGKPLNLADIPRVITPEFVHGTAGIAIMETSRGCPNQCKFCGIGLVGMRYYPIDHVEADLEALLSNPEIRRIFIGDADFFTNVERSMRLLDIINKYNRHKTQIELYADFLSVNGELLASARKAMIHDSLRIPIQTIQKKALLTAGRHWFEFEQLRKTVPVVLKHFPSTWAEIIVGLPDDNYKGIKASFKWCLESGLRDARAHRLACLPNSEYAENTAKYGIVHDSKPPHRVYSSKGFSYADIFKSETFSLNYQVMVSFIDSFDYKNLLKLGIDMIDVAEKLHTLPDWTSAYIPDEEANILEARPEAAGMIIDYLRHNFEIGKPTVAFLSDLFRYRFACLSLYKNFKQNVLYSTDYENSPFNGSIPVIPFFDRFETGFDLLSYLDGKMRLDKPKSKKTNILLLYNHLMNRVVPLESEYSESFTSILNNLGRISADRNISPLHAKHSVTCFVETLESGGFVYFTKSPAAHLLND